MTTPYDAIVYDLDGTLVELAVDWGALADTVREMLEAEGVDPGDVELWQMVDLAAEAGIDEQVRETITETELAGARESRRLPVADELPWEVPVGVCSLNCEAACEIALERHDLAGAIDAVVGRDSVPEKKPDPEPLLAAVEALGAEPERTLFVGNSPRDGVTAEAAGTDFEYVSDR